MKNPVQAKLSGFTLIELLVVVLIIGILSAIALPQYQRAVLRARFAEIELTLGALSKANERYYLANDEYPFGISDLDIEIPACKCLPGLCTTCRYHIEKGPPVSMQAIDGGDRYFILSERETSNCAGKRHPGVIYATMNVPESIRKALGFTVDANTCGTGYEFSRP